MIHVFGRPLRPPSQLTRLLLLGLLAAVLMILDHRGNQLAKIRSALSILAAPVHFVAALPARAGAGLIDFFQTRDALRGDVERLQSEREILMARVQQQAALEAENNRLREMLGSATRVADRVLAAELIEVTSEPGTRQILIARGTRDAVTVGQPVIDAYGVMGQVTRVMHTTSQVTLITDAGHAIPVLVTRNGLRALVYGTGDQDTVRVPYLTALADIKEGDLLVTSGMGGTFPPGYPVATVTKIVNDPNESFLDITAKPTAHINYSKQVLLIWPGVKPPQPDTPPKAERGKLRGRPGTGR